MRTLTTTDILIVLGLLVVIMYLMKNKTEGFSDNTIYQTAIIEENWINIKNNVTNLLLYWLVMI